MSAPSRIPGPAIAAAVLAAVGVLPLVVTAFLVVALGGLESDTGRDWPTVLLLVVPPFLQLFALGWLLFRRGRVPLVLSALVTVAVAVMVVVVADSAGQAVGAGPFVLAVFPVAAAVVAMSPAVGRWLAAARAERRDREA